MSIVAPDPTLDFVGVFVDQTEDVILARMQDWANEGLDPVANADEWTDTSEGSHWWTSVMPGVRELARIYDLAGTEIPMSGFVLWAWGTYLDDLAAVYDLTRKPATFATGLVTFSGPAGIDITAATTVTVEPSSPTDPVPAFATLADVTIPDLGGGSGSIDSAIQAVDAGQAGDVPSGAITVPSTPLDAGVSFTNAAATGGGSDPETDDSLRTRILQAVAGQGPGAVADYVRWASAWPGVGGVRVVPTPTGANTVLVVVTDPAGQPLPGAVVSALQVDLDPVAGKGEGTAPVGAQVDVETSTIVTVNVAATVTYEAGYSALGLGDTVAVAGDIANQLRSYFLSVLPGDQVVVAHVAGIIATWPGVHDVTAVLLNGAGVNLTMTLTPPEAPILGTLTI